MKLFYLYSFSEISSDYRDFCPIHKTLGKVELGNFLSSKTAWEQKSSMVHLNIVIDWPENSAFKDMRYNIIKPAWQ